MKSKLTSRPARAFVSWILATSMSSLSLIRSCHNGPLAVPSGLRGFALVIPSAQISTPNLSLAGYFLPFRYHLRDFPHRVASLATAAVVGHALSHSPSLGCSFPSQHPPLSNIVMLTYLLSCLFSDSSQLQRRLYGHCSIPSI